MSDYFDKETIFGVFDWLNGEQVALTPTIITSLQGLCLYGSALMDPRQDQGTPARELYRVVVDLAMLTYLLDGG